MEHVYDMIIIGGGPAGYTAALYAARAGLDVALVEKAGAGGQMALTDVIDNYPGFEQGVDGFTLGMNMQKQAERFGAKTVFGEVSSVDLTKKIKEIRTAFAHMYAKAVVLSTGADPRELGLENEHAYIGKGVHYCAHCDGRFYKDKTVIVVGGGNSAVADALYLSRLAKKVYLVHRRDQLRAEKILSDPLFKADNVEILWNSVSSGLVGDGRISGAVIRNVLSGAQFELPADGIFVSIGRTPSTAFLKGQIALDESGYIKADETTVTSVPGVFAVGDVRTKPLRQVVTAVSDGAVAVHFAEEYLASVKV